MLSLCNALPAMQTPSGSTCRLITSHDACARDLCGCAWGVSKVCRRFIRFVCLHKDILAKNKESEVRLGISAYRRI